VFPLGKVMGEVVGSAGQCYGGLWAAYAPWNYFLKSIPFHIVWTEITT